MTTIIMRHGQTPYSVSYRVNGDPAVDLGLNADGINACQRAAKALPSGIRTWVVTELRRTQESACIVAGRRRLRPVIEKRLNEVDYGTFDGGTFLDYGAWLHEHGGWKRPGTTESQREGLRRMLHGLHACLELPAPRVIVAHGLLVSVLLWRRDPATDDEKMPLFFPEAPYAQPLTLNDDTLDIWVRDLLRRLAAEERRPHTTPRSKPMRAMGPSVATFRTVLTQPATKDSDHA